MASTPAYIFRGHKASVNAVTFFDHDQCIASCDADGMVCIWKMKTRRSILEWKAHSRDCLQVTVFGDNKLVSQGRDHMVHVWQLSLNEPCEATIIHSIEYYSLSFCRLSVCQTPDDTLICLPLRGDTSLVDIYSINQGKWIMQRIGDKEEKDGLCMAVQLFCKQNDVHVLAGYEDGSVALWDLHGLVWKVKEHTAPVLHLRVDRTASFAISTGADNQVIKYGLSRESVVQKATAKKSGLAAVDIRDDGKIFATAGHDGRIRIFSCKSLKPLAVLSYHRESVYAVAFGSSMEKEHWVVGGSKESRISLWSIY